MAESGSEAVPAEDQPGGGAGRGQGTPGLVYITVCVIRSPVVMRWSSVHIIAALLFICCRINCCS